MSTNNIPPLQPMSNKTIKKRDKHPMIKIQQIKHNQKTKFLSLKNSLNPINGLSDQFIQPQHPSIKNNNPTANKQNENENENEDQYNGESLNTKDVELDNISCSELCSSIPFGDSLFSLIPNINDNMCDNSSIKY
eukprot:277736_1